MKANAMDIRRKRRENSEGTMRGKEGLKSAPGDESQRVRPTGESGCRDRAEEFCESLRLHILSNALSNVRVGDGGEVGGEDAAFLEAAHPVAVHRLPAAL